MTLIYYSQIGSPSEWERVMTKKIPGLDFRVWGKHGKLEEIEFALVWLPPHDFFNQFPNLKAIFSLGAGVDSLLRDPFLPTNIPIIRLTDDRLTQRMVEYVVLHVLRYHRMQPLFEKFQIDRVWKEVQTPIAQQRKVGIMGLGVLGKACANALANLGFNVSGWAKTPKNIQGIATYYGENELEEFVKINEILVCLLPLTSKTDGILNKKVFNWMHKGSFLINVGRGYLQNEDDIISALDSGKLEGVTLDVFRTEPLPLDHQFWNHPKVTVTPHVASITDPETAALKIAEKICTIRNGELPEGIIDLECGY